MAHFKKSLKRSALISTYDTYLHPNNEWVQSLYITPSEGPVLQKWLQWAVIYPARGV